MRKAVFLDRDGVINRVIVEEGQVRSPRSFAEFELADGVAGCLQAMRALSYLVIVVTNQPDIARGKMPPADLEKMSEVVRSQLAVDDMLVCPHDDVHNCMCRKPKPGMLLEAKEKHDIDLRSSYMVGDGWKDMEAARNAGCRGILIGADYNEGVACFKRVEGLKEAVRLLGGDGGA